MSEEKEQEKKEEEERKEEENKKEQDKRNKIRTLEDLNNYVNNLITSLIDPVNPKNIEIKKIVSKPKPEVIQSEEIKPEQIKSEAGLIKISTTAVAQAPPKPVEKDLYFVEYVESVESVDSFGSLKPIDPSNSAKEKSFEQVKIVESVESVESVEPIDLLDTKKN